MRAAALLLALTAVASAAPPRAPRTEVERLLAGIERAPTRAEVERLGPGAEETLIAIADDPRTSRLRRMRAIYALGFRPSEAARAYAEAVLAEKGAAGEGADTLDAAAALAALAPYGEEALPTALRYLTHASGDVRQAAAALIGAWRAPSAEGLLRARLAVERDPGVRVELRGALRALSR